MIMDFLMCPEIKEGGPLTGGGCSQVGCLFLFFTTIALYFDIVGKLGPSLSLPNKWTKFVNFHELFPPKLHLLETLILLTFLLKFSSTEQQVKMAINGLTCLVYAFKTYWSLRNRWDALEVHFFSSVWGHKGPLKFRPEFRLISLSGSGRKQNQVWVISNFRFQ